MIRIIHISDFHLEKEELTFPKKTLVNALSQDIKNFITDNTLLFFTGDLIDKGGVKFSSKANVFHHFEKNFIDEILTQNSTLSGNFFCVPGNHDVFREDIDEYSEAGIKEKLKDSSELQIFIQKNRKSSKHLDRLQEYKKWEGEFYKKYNTAEISNFECTFNLNIEGLKVGITCFNSAWLCKDDNDKGNILLGKEQIENSLSRINDCQVKLALIHHPIEFFSDYDRESIKPLLFKHYDILFTGHVHELESSYNQDLIGDIFISISNSTIGDNPKERKFVNGYSIIDFYPNDKIVAQYRKYVEQHACFVPNTDIGTIDGIKTFKLPSNKNQNSIERGFQIVGEIESKYVEKLNEDIIMSSIYTNTNCSINNLFVEPNLLNNPQDTLDEKDTKRYTIEKILSSNENYLIYGLKESGKTILLDKLFIDALSKFYQLNKIPVFFKFSELKKKEIKTIIKEFTSISSMEFDEFLKQTKVILLIDDLSFNDKNTIILKKLKDFADKYNNTQIIATSTLISETTIPTTYLDHNEKFQFNLVFIQNLNSSQIRSLVTKWFNGKDIDLQESMQKLLKSFGDFGLPKTPLSVTLFLWIFEKQEKRPINNSVLVEIFIENLLEKTNIDNIYSDTFDFANKKRLLSFAAKFMKNNGDGDLSYSIDYIDMLQYFKNYLSSRFTGQPNKILDDFISRGIFIYEDENLIRFKSAFFFHYFLALQFDYDLDFRTEVLTGENYLNYVDEIIYYTGLKRDDQKFLIFTQEKLHMAFSSYNESIVENYQKLDLILESNKQKTIAFRLDDKKIEIKPNDEQLDQIYDDSLSVIPSQTTIAKKDESNLETNKNLDKILKLAACVLKNSEDVDDFEIKKAAYSNILTSSFSFLMQYRDALLWYYSEHKKQPDFFPKNINFEIFVKILPLIHQVVLFNWLGSQKLRPVILDKIKKDKQTLNISDLEKYVSVFVYADIRGSDYPEIIKSFVENSKLNYIKDLSFLKILSYYHLRKNGDDLDLFYLKLMANIRQGLGYLDKRNKSKFMHKLKLDKRKK